MKQLKQMEQPAPICIFDEWMDDGMKTRFREAVVEHCAPTLAGLKTGNIFTIPNGRYELLDEIRTLNRLFCKRGLRIVPIRRTENQTMIYLYRPDWLRQDLGQPEAEDILTEKGYCLGNADCCLVQLMRHLASDEDFPHEIGLFLGYPPSDVKCFMRNTREGVKCVGCWKAYNNPGEAEKTFERFRKCTALYLKQVIKGKTLESLIVDTSQRKQRQTHAA